MAKYEEKLPTVEAFQFTDSVESMMGFLEHFCYNSSLDSHSQYCLKVYDDGEIYKTVLRGQWAVINKEGNLEIMSDLAFKNTYKEVQ